MDLEKHVDIAASALFETINPKGGPYETLPEVLKHKYRELALPVVLALSRYLASEKNVAARNAPTLEGNTA